MHSPKDAIVILPPDIVAKVKESELTNPHRSGSHWTCGHCTVHLGDLKLREAVVTHLKSVYVTFFTLTHPSPFLILTIYFFYFSGTGSIRLASQKIYSSSHETRLSLLSRRATRLMHPPIPALWRPSAACNVPMAKRPRRIGCSISKVWRAILVRSKQFTAVVD